MNMFSNSSTLQKGWQTAIRSSLSLDQWRAQASLVMVFVIKVLFNGLSCITN